MEHAEIHSLIETMFREIDRRLHEIERKVNVCEEQGRLILENAHLSGRQLEKIMSQIDDLGTAVGNIQTDVQNVNDKVSTVQGDVANVGNTVTQVAADIQTAIQLIQNNQGDNPQLADAIAKLNDAHGKLTDSANTLQTSADSLTAVGTSLNDADVALGGAINPGPGNPGGDAAKAASVATTRSVTGEPAGSVESGAETDKDGNPVQAHPNITGGPRANEVDRLRPKSDIEQLTDNSRTEQNRAYTDADNAAKHGSPQRAVSGTDPNAPGYDPKNNVTGSPDIDPVL